MDPGRGSQHRELPVDAIGIVEMRRMQRPRIAELANEQRDARILGERRVIGANPGACEELGDGCFVHFAVLAQVECRQVEPEHVGGAAQRVEPPLRERFGAVQRERFADRGEVGAEVGHARIRRGLGLCRKRGRVSG